MYKRGNGGTIATASAVVTEVPWNEYTDEVKDSVTYGDANDRYIIPCRW